MRLIKEDFQNLSAPESKIKRTPVSGYSGLYCEQSQAGYTFQIKFKSPVIGTHRFMKLTRFKYGDLINKKMLDNVVKQLVIKQGVVAQGLDPLEVKKEEKQANLPAMQGKTVNKVFDAYISTNYFSQLSYSTRNHYLANYRVTPTEISSMLGISQSSFYKLKTPSGQMLNYNTGEAIKTLHAELSKVSDNQVALATFLFKIRGR